MNCKASKAAYDAARYAAKEKVRAELHGPRTGRNGHTVHHRMTGTPEYRSWLSMKRRCEVEHDKDYPRYGGRGIAVCHEWSEFDAFFRDMGPRPKGSTIDRRDNSKGYSKENCRWATTLEQNRNRRIAVNVEWRGEIKPLKVLCDECGQLYSTVHSRLFKHGWPLEAALLLPKNSRFKPLREAVADKAVDASRAAVYFNGEPA